MRTLRKYIDGPDSVVEYLLALVYLAGALTLNGREPLVAEGFVVLWLGGTNALYFYMVWFCFLAVGLVYAKIKKRKRLHKNILLGMYLTPIYFAVLFTAWFGFDPVGMLDNLVITLAAGLAWIRWKFKTEYINPRDFQFDEKDPRHRDT